MTEHINSQTRQILRASAIMGSSSAVAIVTGIVKTKVMAVLLGPAGIGFMGLLQSILTTAGTISGMGLASSGVREIAAVQADGAPEKMARTRSALWWGAVVFGLIGALVLVLLRGPIARFTFGTSAYGYAIAYLAIGVWATTISGAQRALLNGLRRLGDLARVNIFGSLAAMIIGVLAVWQWGITGVVIAVVTAPLTTMAVSWWLTRGLMTPTTTVTVKDLGEPLRKLLSLGAVFMTTALMTVGTQFLVRLMVTRILGLEATGHFQAAWSISMLYLGFVLQAMGTDYYPRLTAVANDSEAVRMVVNQQAEVALLLAGPVILGMLTLAPQVVCVLYSGAFGETVGVLRWQVLGGLFKVASWPMGFILLAQARSRMFFFTELTWNALYMILVWFGLGFWGLPATGIAFFLCYLFYFCQLWVVVRRTSYFSWCPGNLGLLFMLTASAVTVFFLSLLPSRFYLTLGLIVTGVITMYSWYRLKRAVGGLQWKRLVKRS